MVEGRQLNDQVTFEQRRIDTLIDRFAAMAAGRLDLRAPVSERRDELDAIAHAVNVLCEELLHAGERESKALIDAKEAAESAVETKSQLLRNVSHELRTPLAAMRGLVEVMGRVNLDSATRENLTQRMMINVTALSDMVDDLLDVSKAEAGLLEIQLEPVVLPRFFEEIESVVMPLARSDIDYQWSCAEDIPDVVYLDPRRLRQVVLNVVSNAIKYTLEGQVELDCAPAWSEDQEDALVISIQDSGIGIPAAAQQQIFDPFYRAETGSTDGAGLGLALARHLSEKMGGSLKLQHSEPDRGSTFLIQLPLVCESNTSSKAEVSDRSSKDVDLSGIRVLIAEDNDDIARFLQMALETAGARVGRVEDGQALLEVLSDTEFDCLLLDIRMPRLNGLEALSALRADGFDGHVIALSADADPMQKQACLDAGCNAFLIKPVAIDHLLETCRHVCC